MKDFKLGHYPAWSPCAHCIAPDFIGTERVWDEYLGRQVNDCQCCRGDLRVTKDHIDHCPRCGEEMRARETS